MNRFNCLTSRNDYIMFVFLRKQAIINKSKCFVCELFFFFKNMTIINFFARNNFLLLHDLMNFSEKIANAMNIDEAICCENILITCFASCLDMRCDLRNTIQIFSCKDCLWRFVLVILLDHLIVSVLTV